MDDLRNRIDEVDAQILQLLNERAKCVVEIGKIKLQQKVGVLVPHREQELLNRLCSLNQGPMNDEMLRHIFQEIIDTLKALQK